MRRIAASLLLLSLASCTLVAQTGPMVLRANVLLVRPTPSAPLADWTADAGRATVSVESGATLRGWTYASTRKHAPRVLFFNGNGMTIDAADPAYRRIAELGAEVTVFDYRGVGFSEGTPDVMQFRKDSLALYDRMAATGPVVVFGFSLGTAMASFVASQRTVAGLILAGTIGSAQEELPVYVRASGYNGPVMAAPDAIEAFDEEGLATHSSAPLLMLHGEADNLVPIAQGRAVFAVSVAKQKKFVPLPGVPHNGTISSPVALEAIRTFLAGFKS